MATVTVTREQVMEKVANLGLPLTNIFILEEDAADPLAEIVFWHPKVGFRSLIIENDAMARAVHDYLRNVVGVRRFKSWEDLVETQRREEWEGWNTCADWVRHQKTADEVR